MPFDVEPPEEPEEEPLPDMDAWSSLLSELKTESVQPDENLPCCRTSRSCAAATASAEPAPSSRDPEPERAEPRRDDVRARDLARGVRRVAGRGARAGARAEPEAAEEVLEEQEIGMSLAELEESLKREKRA